MNVTLYVHSASRRAKQVMIDCAMSLRQQGESNASEKSGHMGQKHHLH